LIPGNDFGFQTLEMPAFVFSIHRVFDAAEQF